MLLVRKDMHVYVLNLSGTADRPRLNVFRSNKHIYAQLIDDVNGVTLASASTLDKDLILNLQAMLKLQLKGWRISCKTCCRKRC